MKLTPRRLAAIALAGGGALVFLGSTLAAVVYFKRHGWSGDKAFQLEQPPRFEWRSVEKKHWQAVSAIEEETPVTDGREGTRGACSAGMVEVRGKHLLDATGHDTSGEIEELQNKTCTNWISKDFPARCQTFDRGKWLELSEKLPRKAMAFCADRYEYPNVKGANPVIVVTYHEGTSMCKAAGKRLCTETEWTFACEGEEGVPYPYGYDRDPEACVVDQPWKAFSTTAMAPRDGPNARAELDRLWQGRPSGSRPGCKSPFGVYDMTGNVDEWTKTVRTSGYASVLKGGYWGPVRARCRPATRAHNETFVAYQQGFRCCSDLGASAQVTTSPAANAKDGGAAVASTLARDAGASDGGMLAAARDAGTPGTKVAVATQASGNVHDPSTVPAVDDADEDEQITKFHVEPKVGIFCASAPGGSPIVPGLFAGAAVLAFAARRRRG
jgi:hypothetical protein